MASKKFIKTSIQEYLKESSIDNILDKINKSGINSLTSFEKDILSKGNMKSNIEDDTIDWLNKNYSELHTVHEDRESFGKIKNYIVFLNSSNEMVFEYDILDKKLYISYYDIRMNLGSFFNTNSLKKWFSDKYNIDVLRLGDFFKNIE